MQYKPSKWVSGYKHGPAASYTQITRMGLFLNVATSKFEPLDSTWDNLHSGGMFISGTNKIYFRDETNKDIYINSNADNEITIAATSGVTISGGNLIIGTAGKGIDFQNQASPAAGMTSELLDRYEEGTWTAAFNAGSGTITINTSSDLGIYTRTGNSVHVQGYFEVSSVSTPSGYLSITGLPFSPAGGGENSEYVAGAMRVVGLTGSVNAVQGYVGANGHILISEFTGTTDANDMANHMQASAAIIISLTYTVAT